VNSLPFKQVDVFTQKPFLGNPVAVVLGAESLDSATMQRIAAWTNLSETTFALPPSSTAADYRLRIFTPRQELPFAGHPTVGSAHAVLESGFAAAPNGRLRQECLAGIIELSVEKSELGQRVFVRTPKAKITKLNETDSGRLTSSLGASLAKASAPLRVDVGVVWLVAEMADSRSVARLEPNLESVLQLSLATQAAGVTVFARANDGLARAHVRSFAPALGVAEDPVCGSGNAAVAAYLMHTGLISEFGFQYVARQGMQVGRDGQVAVRVDGRHHDWRLRGHLRRWDLKNRMNRFWRFCFCGSDRADATSAASLG
jgi:PhzF family phenazine biosynthesis protein